MILQLSGTHEWQLLTEEEKTILMNYDDKQMAELALFFTEPPTITTEYISTIHRSTIEENKILDCVSAVLGLEEAYSIFQNTRSLMTARGAVKILKLVGRRYLGWAGLALAVVSFVDCVS